MKKKQLYFIIGALCIVLLYVLFMPTAEVTAPEEVPTSEDTDIQVLVDETLAVEGVAQEQVVIETQKEPEPMTLKGTFVGLLDGEDAYQKKFKYLLLNDGMEVLRMDLRPLVGYSDLNIIEKLGVDRGDRIVATGVVTNGEFSVTSIVRE
jgi:hypothetical protein